MVNLTKVTKLLYILVIFIQKYKVNVNILIEILIFNIQVCAILDLIFICHKMQVFSVGLGKE